MTGPLILVTGSTDGIGKATARALAGQGAQVILHGRDPEKGETVLKELKNRTWNRNLDLLIADLSEKDNILRLADEIRSGYGRLDVLINNAGVYEKTRKVTPDGTEMTIAVNYLAPFLLTRELLPLLQKSAPSRIVNVASAAHRDIWRIEWENLQGEEHYDPFGAYALSMFAKITHTYSLAESLSEKGVTVNCLHPGTVATKMLRAGFPGIRGISPAEGAKIPVYLATSPDVAAITAGYFEEPRKPERSSALSYDRTVQKRLWETAERLILQGSR